MPRHLICALLLFFSASIHAGTADTTNCDWPLETMSFKTLDEIHREVEDEGRFVFMSMFDKVDVEPGSACSSGGGSTCTVMAIINKNTGQVKMAHLAGQQPQIAEAYIKKALEGLGGAAEAQHLQVIMAGNQVASMKYEPEFQEEKVISEQYAEAIRNAFAAGGVKPQQIRDYLSSTPEEYAYDITVDTQTKKIYVARKKVKQKPNAKVPQ